MKSVAMWHAKLRGLRITRLLARDGENCALCSEALDRHIPEGSPDYVTFDHIEPVSRGGLTEWKNIRLTHHRCNQAKGDLLDGEFFGVVS